MDTRLIRRNSSSIGLSTVSRKPTRWVYARRCSTAPIHLIPCVTANASSAGGASPLEARIAELEAELTVVRMEKEQERKEKLKARNDLIITLILAAVLYLVDWLFPGRVAPAFIAAFTMVKHGGCNRMLSRAQEEFHAYRDATK